MHCYRQQQHRGVNAYHVTCHVVHHPQEREQTRGSSHGTQRVPFSSLVCDLYHNVSTGQHDYTTP